MQLLPFQEKAVNDMVRILRLRGGVYNAYEMGLGKTIQSIMSCRKLSIAAVLVVCPAVVKIVWEKETRIWSNRNTFFDVFSYDHIARHAETLGTVKYDCLILDEAHKVKNHKSQRSQAIFTHLWPNIRYKICLSGTPFTKNVVDCWTLFSRLAPEHFKDYWRFVHRYTNVKRTPFGTKFEGIKNADELKRIIRSTFFIRETIESVGLELPEKTWQEIPLPESLAVTMTPEQEAAQKEYQKAIIAAFKSDQPLRMAPPISSSTWQKAQGLKKLPSIIEFSKNLLDQGIPCVIFGYHKEFISELKKALEKYKPVVITGDASDRDREHAVRTFQEGGSDVFIGNIEAAGVGITLTRSSTVLLGEFPWLPSTIQQAISRCHRIGQRNHVNIYYFVVEKSSEQDIMKVLVDRATDFKSVLEG